MLHSHSFQDKAFESFASFLRNILSGDDRYKQLVEPILSDAISLSKGEKNYYSVGRDSFDVVVFLAEKDPTFLGSINLVGVSNEQYKKLLELVSGQREEIIA